MAVATLRWPTFAELDRRLDSEHDIQALEVFRELPPGFLYGVDPDSSVPPMDGQEIGLTVAGVAVCHNTREILPVFVEFIQLATSAEKGWQPPADKPTAQPSLTDIEFASLARTLPVADRGHMLQLLFLVLKAEGTGWADYSDEPGTGHWAISFNRQIRVFRKARDIDEYWSRRLKPWEAQSTTSVLSNPPRTSPDSISYTFNGPVFNTSFPVGNHTSRHPVANGPDTSALAGSTRRDSDAIKAARTGGRYAIVAAVLAAIVTAIFTNGFGLFRPSSHNIVPSTSATAIERRYDGMDPTGKDNPRSKCADPPASRPISQIHPAVVGPGGEIVGHVELRTSPMCPVIWARVDWLNGSYRMPAGWSLHILMHRRNNPKTTEYISSDTSGYVYGNMLATVSGCVYAEVYFAKGSSRTHPSVTPCIRGG
jgi:hypothetical protein